MLQNKQSAFHTLSSSFEHGKGERILNNNLVHISQSNTNEVETIIVLY